MKCRLKTCSNTIPNTRRKSSTYCSYECYYKAKKERSRNRYADLREPSEELRRCEGLLAYMYGISQLKKGITVADLQSFNFNFGISSGEYLDNEKRLCKVIGNYAYYVEPNKNLIIWKSK